MKNKSCPDKIACWDYDASNCEGCAVGGVILRQKKSIKRLKSELDITKAALDNLIFYCTNDKKFMCEAVSEKCPRRLNGTILCGSDECGKIMLDFYIKNARREIEEERKND